MTKAEQERFKNFEQDLLKARDLAYKEINIPNEFGLGHWEVKHSEFLAHLFDPNRKQYCLKADKSGSRAYFLRFFFAALEKYNGVDISKKKRPNSGILANGSGTGQAVTAADIEALGRANDLQVKKEAPIAVIEALGRANDFEEIQEAPDEDDKGRIDILLISEQEQTVLVIENKVFSKTHDDQLRKYEAYYQGPEWKKKVFVYLTPQGDTPQNEDETEAVNWCTFDYAALRGVVEDFKNAVAFNGASITELKGKLKNKFIYALEDYMGNIDTEVLNKASGEANAVYAKLLDQYQDLVEGLVGFYNGARPTMIANYCKETILKGHWNSSSRSWIYTNGMKEFFERHGEKIDKKCYIVCQGKNGNKNARSMEIWLELLISNNSPSPAQQIIMNDPGIQGLRVRKKAPGTKNYNIISSQTFLKTEDMTAPDGTYLPLETVLPKIEGKLQPFLELLEKFEERLKKL